MAATGQGVNGDLDGLYREHHGWLLSWLRARMGCRHGAADLAQDTFLRILTTRSSRPGQAPIREPRSYLSTVAGRLLANHYRRLSLERTYLDALALLPEPEVPAPELRLSLLESLQEIDAMLDGLPAPVRTAFLLAQLEGWSYAQIGEQLAVSVRTVKRYMARALQECILLME